MADGAHRTLIFHPHALAADNRRMQVFVDFLAWLRTMEDKIWIAQPSMIADLIQSEHAVRESAG